MKELTIITGVPVRVPVEVISNTSDRLHVRFLVLSEYEIGRQASEWEYVFKAEYGEGIKGASRDEIANKFRKEFSYAWEMECRLIDNEYRLAFDNLGHKENPEVFKTTSVDYLFKEYRDLFTMLVMSPTWSGEMEKTPIYLEGIMELFVGYRDWLRARDV